MPSPQPTCAARVVANPFLKCGWGATLTKETNEVVRGVRKEATAMYQMQMFRNRPISTTSMYTALLWEARSLIQRALVYTPVIEEGVDLFCDDKESYNAAFASLSRKTSEGSDFIEINPLFVPMRSREFTIWPVLVDGAWVTILLHIEPVAIHTPNPNTYFDRQVRAFAIVDPFPTNRRSRRHLVMTRLTEILREGCIELPEPENVEVRSFITGNIEEEWATGHVAFAVSREFIRRLKVALYLRDCNRPNDPASIWAEFAEHPDLDSYRESIMAACAHHAIEKSGYLVRMALEVPSIKSDHKPDNLHCKENSDNQTSSEGHSTTVKVYIDIPEDIRKNVAAGSGTEQQSHPNDSNRNPSGSDGNDAQGNPAPSGQEDANVKVVVKVDLPSRNDASDVCEPQSLPENGQGAETVDAKDSGVQVPELEANTVNIQTENKTIELDPTNSNNQLVELNATLAGFQKGNIITASDSTDTDIEMADRPSDHEMASPSVVQHEESTDSSLTDPPPSPDEAQPQTPTPAKRPAEDEPQDSKRRRLG